MFSRAAETTSHVPEGLQRVRGDTSSPIGLTAQCPGGGNQGNHSRVVVPQPSVTPSRGSGGYGHGAAGSPANELASLSEMRLCAGTHPAAGKCLWQAVLAFQRPTRARRYGPPAEPHCQRQGLSLFIQRLSKSSVKMKTSEESDFVLYWSKRVFLTRDP